jgi:hypothetical protein
MSLQSIAQPDIAKVHAMLSKMDGPQLQKFAAAHQDNAIYVSLAMQVDKDRKEQMQRLQALMTGQEQPKVIPQAVAALNPQGMAPPGMGAQQQGGAPMPPPGGPQGQMPPQGMPPQGPPGMQMPPQAPPAPQGVASLPAPNMEGMADGGIAGYADGGEIRMQAGGTGEDAIRTQLRSLGYPPELIEAAVQRERMAAENATPQRQLPFTPATPSGVSRPNVRSLTSAYEESANPPMIPNPRMTGETPAVGPNDRNPILSREESPRGGIPFTKANIAEMAAKVPEFRGFMFNMENAPYQPQTRSVAAQLAGEVKGEQGQTPYKPAGIATLKAPTVPNIDTPRLTSTPYDVGDKPTVAASKADVGQLVDSSDLMTQVQGAQAGLRGMGRELLAYYDKEKPTKDVFSETVKRLDKEDALAVDKKGQAQGMALMMAGFKMMESPYGGRGLGALLRNAGAGAKIGAESYNAAIDKLEAAADKRAQQRTTIEAAQDAAARGDFNARLGLVQHGQQLKAQADALGISAASTIFGTNATVGATLYSSALNTYNTNKNVAAGLKSEENRAQFAADSADRRAMFGAKMEMLKTQYEQAGANARAMAPTPEMRMALALGGNNLEAGLRKAGEIAAGKTDLAKLYVQAKADFDAKNVVGDKQFMSPQEFVSLYNQVSVFRAPPNPTGSPTGKVFQ